jgi:acyl-homoserine-lactone acylase
MPIRRISITAATLVLSLALIASACTSGDDSASDTPVVGDGTTYEATITRTEGGVPHIVAADLASLSFGQGWASGEDRTCDLADMVVKLQGERARWFGPGDDDANINSDIAARAVDIRGIAEQDWPSASDDVRTLITAFTDGWNAHLNEVGVDGVSGWCAGEPWVRPLEPVEIYSWGRAVTLLASASAVESYVATAEPPAGGGGPADTTPVTDPPGSAPAPGGSAPAPTTSPNPSTGAPAPGPDPEAENEVEVEDEVEAAMVAASPEPVIDPVAASNAWGIGADRAADGGGMLVANPHFPWEGALRFWEVHLTVPGEVNIYGAQLSGLPGIGIGFTETFGWTHTVSAGNRFTAYLLDLVPGDPTSYVYGDEVRQMVPTEITIEVLGDDGQLTEQTVTRWASHYGPILDFPGVGWTEDATITMRDANIGNDEFIEQYLAMMRSADLDEFIAAHRDISGVPAFNTIAVSADGRAWYADTSSTPRLSDEALAGYEQLKTDNFIVGAAAGSGAVLLDGSDPLYEWAEVPGARDPGLVPFDEMPVLERSDYVFNANDSFWMSHATELLAGDYSPLHGRQDTPRTPRTRENATVLNDTSPAGASGDDGTFTLDELAAAALANGGFMSRTLKDDVVQRCTTVDTVTVEALANNGDEVLPAAEVDISQACEVLAGWDGVYDIDRVGAVLWREFLAGFSRDQFLDAGTLWAQPFDPTDPLGSPSGLAAAPADGTDPVLVALARAVQILDNAGLAVDVPLGDVQVAVRGSTRVPIHGGSNTDGTTNIVGYGSGFLTADPEVTGLSRRTLVPGSSLVEVTGDVTTTGYRINQGTSFLLALAYGPGGPRARTMLTYSDTEDRTNPDYVAETERFSAKQWRDVAFTSEQVRDGAITTMVVRG